MVFRRSAILLLLCLAAPHLAVASDSLCGTLADVLVAEEAGLEREWVVQVPFDSSAWRLEHIVIADGLVVAQSGDGGVTAIAAVSQGIPAAAAGTVLWSQRVGRPGDTVQPAAIGSAVVAVAGSLDLVGLDRRTGEVVWQEAFGSAVAAGPAVSGEWIYAPLDGNGVMRLATAPRKKQLPLEVVPQAAKKKKKQKTERRPPESLGPKSIDAGGRVETPPVAFGNGVAWCTADGLIVALDREENAWRRLEFDLRSPPAGPLLPMGDGLVATTIAGDLATIERTPLGLRTGWHVRLADPAAGSVLAAGDTLVVPVSAGGAVAFAATTGEFLWRSDAPRHLLAADATHLWCVDASGRLAVFDPADGARLASFCSGPFTLPVTNVSSDRLVLASPKGVVVSLVPRRPRPVSGSDAPAPASADPAATPREAARTAADPSE